MDPSVRIFAGPEFITDVRSGASCEALAVADGRILRSGTYFELKKLFPHARVIDLGIGFAYPGLADAHGHLTRLGRSLSEVDLTACRSWEEVLAKVVAYAQTHPQGWILGRGWNNEKWADRQFPDRYELDRLIPDRPVLLERIDIHTALVNGVALSLAGMTEVTTIAGGEILWEKGVPTGLLFDHAIDPVWAQIPAPSFAETQTHLLLAQKSLFAHGIVSVGDALLPDSEIEVIEALKSEGHFPLRVYGMLPADEHHLETWLPRGPKLDPDFTLRAFKVFADGTMGSRTAWLREPYADKPSTQGIAIWETEILQHVAEKVYQGGFQLCAHTIGDAALAQVLGVYRQALKGDKSARWRIEHVQLADQAQLNDFQAMGIIASLQPQHAASDAPWIVERLGADRVTHTYPLKSLIYQAPDFALGSDFPVEPPDALAGMAAAIFRRNPLNQTESISPSQALWGYTGGAAYATFAENSRGKLLPGFEADITVVDSPLMDLRTWEGKKPGILATVVAGEIVFPDSSI